MRKFFGNKLHPIGIDLGSSSLKVVQLMTREGRLGLMAAAKADVPRYVRGNVPALQEWFVSSIRELLSEKPFKGKKVVTCLPAREMLIQHLRLAKMDEKQLAKALPWEAQGKLPFDINRALLRHIIAGEVYETEQSKLEVILMAASRNVVEQHLRLIERTKVEVEYINVEPCALVNCFAHLLKRGDEQAVATMFVDLGHSCTKVVVSYGTNIVFGRTISIGSEHIYQAICEKLSVDYERAVQLHRNLTVGPDGEATSGLGDKEMIKGQAEGLQIAEAERAAGSTAILTRERRGGDVGCAEVEAVISPILANLCEEMRSCVRYHDLLFHGQPVKRVIFLGGQAKNKVFCQKLAQNLGLPAQLGDPLARIDPQTRIGSHSDLEPDELHSDWAVAFGLSLGGIEAE